MIGRPWLDIGANHIIRDLNPSTCALNGSDWNADFAVHHQNLTGIFLFRLVSALTDRRGVRAGDLMMSDHAPGRTFAPTR